MKRLTLSLVCAFLPRVLLASGFLNILLAGSIFPLTSSVSPTSITYSFPSATLTSSSTTCSGTGGIKPYTFAWSWGSGGSGIGINSASSANTSFTVSSAAVNTTYSGTAQCLVTDARPVSAPYADVSVSMTRIPLFPGTEGTATLVAGTSAPYTGYSKSLSFGSLSPDTDYNSNTVYAIDCEASEDILNLEITQSASNSTYIAELSINGTLYPTSSATYTFSGGLGNWAWGGITCPMTSGDSYNVLYY